MLKLTSRTILIVGNFVRSPSSESFLSKLLALVSANSYSVIYIGGDRPRSEGSTLWKNTDTRNANNGGRVHGFLKAYLLSLIWTMVLCSKTDGVIVLPTSSIPHVLIARILRRKSGLFVAQLPSSALLSKLARMNVRLSNLVLVESQCVLEDWILVPDQQKVLDSSIFVDLEVYDIRIPIDQRPYAFGFIGTLDDRKGVRNLIAALPTVFDALPDATCAIAGKGPLSRFVEELAGKEPRICYFGFLPSENLPSFYNSIRLLILPSSSEGMPNVALEALASGTPVLATSVGGLRELVREGETGFFLDKGNPASIGRSIVKALSFDSLAQCSENARNIVEFRFSFSAAVDRYSLILKSLSESVK